MRLAALCFSGALPRLKGDITGYAYLARQGAESAEIERKRCSKRRNHSSRVATSNVTLTHNCPLAVAIPMLGSNSALSNG